MRSISFVHLKGQHAEHPHSFATTQLNTVLMPELNGGILEVDSTSFPKQANTQAAI